MQSIAFKQIADDIRKYCPYVKDFLQLGHAFKQIADHAKTLAAYKRPALYVFTDEVPSFED